MDPFSEDFDCGWCGREDVFTVFSGRFALIGDNSRSRPVPMSNVIKKVCPHCGEESEFAMEWEDTSWGGYYFIYEVDED